MRLQYLSYILVMALLIGCKETADAQYELKEAYSNVEIDSPVEAVYVNDGQGRLYIVSQEGRIFWLPANNPQASEATLFLDISDKVVSGGEMGLLGLDFHPDFKSNGYFYVNYTAGDPLETRISQFTWKQGSSGQVDPKSESVLLTYEQPYRNHNGGKVAFGPDGYLYISAGDGGSGGDPQNNSQDRTKLLGKILRIDVDTPSGNRSYGIPADNPYAKNKDGFREEIYAYGLRNPWKFSFDSEKGTLWAADVGQNKLEEVDIIRNGGNYGWRIMEATDCFKPSSNCDQTGLILPVHEYQRSEGVSVTGGFVYRGKNIPALQGKYIYGDYASGKIWALSVDGNGKKTGNTLLLTTGFPIATFGEDQDKELLLLSYGSDGKIYRLSSQPE
jgi:glucose/arabinose dehydrogenase